MGSAAGSSDITFIYNFNNTIDNNDVFDIEQLNKNNQELNDKITELEHSPNPGSKYLEAMENFKKLSIK